MYLNTGKQTPTQLTSIAPQQPIPRCFTFQLVSNRIVCNLRLISNTKIKLKIQLHKQGGIGLPLDAMKFTGTEDANTSLGPGLSVS